MNLKLCQFGGSGPLLVLGPSLGTSVTNLWARCAQQLAGRFRVVGWDLPGHGGAPAASGFTVGDLAASVLSTLDDAGLSGSFHYAGNSIGGAVGLHLLTAAPERVDRAVLLCTGARIGTPELWHERAAAVRSAGTAVLLDTAPGRWFAPGFTDRDPSAAKALLDDLAATDAESYAAACESLAQHDLRADLYRIATPVLAVAGAHDVPTPPATLRHIALGVPRGRLVVLDDVAHLAPVENPPVVAELVAEHCLAAVAPDVTAGQISAAGMRVRREVLGDEWVDAVSARAPDLTGEFQSFLTRYAWGEVWARPGLDRRSRSIVTISALVARGHHEELAAHLRAALRNGLTRAEISEILLQTAIYCGVPAAYGAFRVAATVLAEPSDQDG